MQTREAPPASSVQPGTQTLGVALTTGTRLPTNADFEPLARQLLAPCAKDMADKATIIRRRLKADLGRWQAEAVLSLYNEVCLRHKGLCSRYFTDKAGATLKLQRPTNLTMGPLNGHSPGA
jgi:hypothetical protein